MINIQRLNNSNIFLTLVSGIVILTIILLSEYIPFLDPFSLFLVIGGTLVSGCIAYNFDSIISSIKTSYYCTPLNQIEFENRIAYFSTLSQIVRHKGNIALEKFASNEEEPLMKKGLQLLADGAPHEELKHLLSNDISVIRAQKESSIEILHYLASVAPAAGLIGTIAGLIIMLGDIENSSQLSSGMSLALLTTLYGAILSNLVLQPLATKLDKKLKDEEMLHRLSLEGILALSKGLNPQLMHERLEAFSN